MSAVTGRMINLSAQESLYLLGGARLGRLVYEQRDSMVIRPGAHVLEYGRLIVRAPVPTVVLRRRGKVTYHVDQIESAAGIGWAVTAIGPAEIVADEDEAAHYRRTLFGWTHGPHDALLRIHPQTVTGFRFAAGSPSTTGAQGRSRSR